MSNVDESGIETMRIRDWRQALRSPPTYRIVNRTLRNQKHFITVVSVTGMIVLLILYLMPKKNLTQHPEFTGGAYNYTYPLTMPIRAGGMHTYRIGIIADLDTNSLSKTEKHTWCSYFKKGFLSYSPTKRTVVVTWDDHEPVRLTTHFALKNRGMELSELVVFDGRLLAFDDRTGMIFEIVNDKAVPWVLLMDGNGRSLKGFKSEWATVREQCLVVGSMGKEWTTASGEFQHNDPQFIKKVLTNGEVHHVNWINEYKRVREVLDIHWPGYMIHESGAWSDYHKRWFFLPRRCSRESYNETLDETRGCSVLITADSDVYDVKTIQLPNKYKTRGFSSFKFIPTSDDSVIVALRTEEVAGKTATYITAFDVDGTVLLEDTHVSDLKYEGFEFI